MFARGRVPRSTLIVGLLVATLAMTGWLAYEALQAARSHRAAAENVLRDYARFAAWELTRVAQREVMNEMNSSLGRLQTAIRRDGVGAAMGTDGAGCDCKINRHVRSAFLMAAPDESLAFGGAALGTRVREAVDRMVEGVRRASNGLECPHLLILGDPERTAIVWRVHWDRSGRPTSVVGFAADEQFVTTIFTRIVKSAPLLPPSLVPAGSNPNDALSVRVIAADGRALFASSDEWSAYAAGQDLPPEFGGLKMEAALRPDAAGRLIIGGLPRERLPLVMGLLAVTTGLVIVALVQLRREAELSRLRADFVSGVSHELRTPLAQIRMFSETLLLGRVRSSGEGRRSLEIIAREAQRLTQLVENVLFFARAERRAPKVTTGPARLDTIVADVVECFAPLAEARRTRVETRLEAGVSCEVDAAALRQVLLNLLDNAVKYGPMGQTVVVTLSLERQERPEEQNGTSGVARITVDDEGTGVPTAEASRIWQPFSRLAGAEAAAAGGAGIGLAIVRQLVELHGGRVRVEEAPGGGARFVVLLPRAWTTQVPADEGASDRDPGADQGARTVA